MKPQPPLKQSLNLIPRTALEPPNFHWQKMGCESCLVPKEGTLSNSSYFGVVTQDKGQGYSKARTIVTSG